MKTLILLSIAFVTCNSFVVKKKRNTAPKAAVAKVVIGDTNSAPAQKVMVEVIASDLNGLTAKEAAAWYKVSFISIGAGIDLEAFKSCTAFIRDFEKEYKVSVEFKSASWGREGEKDYCFALGNLSDTNQKLFKTQLEKLLIHSALVRYKYNCPCDKYREVVPEDE